MNVGFIEGSFVGPLDGWMVGFFEGVWVVGCSWEKSKENQNTRLYQEIILSHQQTDQVIILQLEEELAVTGKIERECKVLRW